MTGREFSIQYLSQWAEFGTGTTDIDEVNNSAWIVIGDLVNDKSAGYDIQYNIDSIVIGEIDDTDIAQFSWMNFAFSGSFPYPYGIYTLLNPFPDEWSYWVPRDRLIFEPTISRGSNDWVKDPSVYDNTADDGKYYMAYQVKASGGDGSIYIAETTNLLTGSWTGATQVVTTGAGEDKCEFPFLTRKPNDGDWVLFYDVEDDTPEWRIYVRTSSNSTPYSGWSSATELLDTTGSGAFDDDGCAQPVPIWWSGGYDDGTWILYYAGYDGTTWQSHYATSTTGFDGTYTKGSGGPDMDSDAFSTLVDGAVTRNTAVTLDTTTGLNDGDLIIFDGVRVAIVESVDNSTDITLTTEITLSDNETVWLVTNDGLAIRGLRRINGVWHAWVTAFKYSGFDNEFSAVLIDTSGAIDPRDATWRGIRTTDDLLTFALPVPKAGTTLSAENQGLHWGH